MAFIGLIVAMVILLGLAWYTWPTPTSEPQAILVPTTDQTASSTPVTTSPAATATTTKVTPTPSASPYPTPSLSEQTSTIQIGGQTLYVDLAENPAQQELGLGNRASLGTHQGMLFIFPDDEVHMFWMKDMSFSIDMIWLSDDGTVIYIQPNTAPDTYPEAFGPSSVSRYVLEVPANYAADHGIVIGSKAVLP